MTIAFKQDVIESTDWQHKCFFFCKASFARREKAQFWSIIFQKKDVI